MHTPEQEPAIVISADSADEGGGTLAGTTSPFGDPPVRSPHAPVPPPPREPSWPRVLANTVELWVKRHRLRRVYLVVLALVAALAAGVGTVLAQGTPGGTGQVRRAAQRPGPGAAVVSAQAQAASWVAGQVSHGVTVACDPAMCTLLQQHGFPAGNLAMIHPGAADPAGASLIVGTAALRGESGSRLASWYAPVLMASFGAGSGRVDIWPNAPAGAAAYLSSQRADLATRKSVGAELLRNSAVVADPAARQQLTQGLADSRLIAMIGIMAALHPVHLVAFGDASPGADPGVPLRSAVLYGVTHGVTAGNALLSSLRGLLLMQHSSYRPASVQTIRLGTGQNALRIVFAAPDPFGLLNASQPLVRISSP